MTQIASKYHKDLQKKPAMIEERWEAIKKVKKNISIKLQENQATEIGPDEILEAIKKTENNKCPGPSRITYEFWKK